MGLLRNPFHSISIFMPYNNPVQQHPITSKFGQTCRMGAHWLNVQRHKQKGPAGNATLVINSDGEQLISSSSGGLCLSAADYRKAELPGGVGWWKWRFVCGAAPSARSERPEPLTASFATVLGVKYKQRTVKKKKESCHFNLKSVSPLLVFQPWALGAERRKYFSAFKSISCMQVRQTFPPVPCWKAWPKERLETNQLALHSPAWPAVWTVELCVSDRCGLTSK